MLYLGKVNCSLAGSARRHYVLGAQRIVASHPLGIDPAIQIAVYRAITNLKVGSGLAPTVLVNVAILQWVSAKCHNVPQRSGQALTLQWKV